jgi:hypothetical protein
VGGDRKIGAGDPRRARERGDAQGGGLTTSLF